jgi:hypothetical protein
MLDWYCTIPRTYPAAASQGGHLIDPDVSIVVDRRSYMLVVGRKDLLSKNENMSGCEQMKKTNLADDAPS